MYSFHSSERKKKESRHFVRFDLTSLRMIISIDVFITQHRSLLAFLSDPCFYMDLLSYIYIHDIKGAWLNGIRVIESPNEQHGLIYLHHFDVLCKSEGEKTRVWRPIYKKEALWCCWDVDETLGFASCQQIGRI